MCIYKFLIDVQFHHTISFDQKQPCMPVHVCVCVYMYKEKSRRIQMVEGLTIYSLVSKLYFIQLRIIQN